MSCLYIDCSMGAAGDMMTAALLELTEDNEKALAQLNALGIPNVRFYAHRVQRGGVFGTKMSVKAYGEEEACGESQSHGHYNGSGYDHGHGRHHIKLKDVDRIIGGLQASEQVKSSVREVYGIIAAAESEAHRCTVEEVHFHEVGALDAIADVAAVSYLVEKIHPDKIIASAVHVGNGTVQCAHGILPVPAPATAAILKGLPYYKGEIYEELCTPTGAALLRYFADAFLEKEEWGRRFPFGGEPIVGRGMGSKEFDIPNCLCAYYYESQSQSRDARAACRPARPCFSDANPYEQAAR